jgi:hypothetical protein
LRGINLNLFMKKAPYFLTLAAIAVIATVFSSFHGTPKATNILGNNKGNATQGDRGAAKNNNLDFSTTEINKYSKSDSLCSGLFSKQKALTDIKSGKARLLVQGGIATVYYPTDKSFRETYKIGYELFGCVAPATINCLEEYNQVVFEYLQSTYGDKWKNDVRKDVIGLSTQ